MLCYRGMAAVFFLAFAHAPPQLASSHSTTPPHLPKALHSASWAARDGASWGGMRALLEASNGVSNVPLMQTSRHEVPEGVAVALRNCQGQLQHPHPMAFTTGSQRLASTGIAHRTGIDEQPAFGRLPSSSSPNELRAQIR